jgi:hypothetical protein
VKLNGHNSVGYNRLLTLLDRQEEQKQEITRLRERNLELELLLRSALVELAHCSEELPSKFRRLWIEQHDPDMQRIRETL